MNTRPEHRVSNRDLPDLFTVEEAARLLRIGRTKAYTMTREWRSSGGESGLPVVDFGNLLRVPRHKLEELIGAPLTACSLAESAAPDAAPTADDGQRRVADRGAPQRKHQVQPAKKRTSSQLELFGNSSSPNGRPS